jgi:hypothetical protein
MLPTWLRRAFLATAAMNVGGGLLFLPPAAPLRALVGVPPGEHAIYLVTLAMFIFLFAAAYGYAGWTGRADDLFVALSAAGKLSFVAILIGFWLAGEVPVLTPLSAVGDLVFGLMFLTWLLTGARRV